MRILEHDLNVAKPSYDGASIVNLMRSIGDYCDVDRITYPPLASLTTSFDKARRVILVVIDGLGTELLDARAPMGALQDYRVANLTSVYPPTTAAAVSTFMSGLAPQQHGLTGWFMYFRQLGTVVAVLPFMPRFSARAISHDGIDIGCVVDCPSFFDAIDAPSATLQPAAIVDSDFSRRLGGKAARRPFQSLDEFAAMLRCACRAESDEKFVYAYWSELDRLAHIHGPSSAIVAEHLQELDKTLGSILKICATNDTLLVITADHGFVDSPAEYHIELDAHPEMSRMLSLPLCGEPRSAYCYVKARYHDKFRDYVGNELDGIAHLVPSEQLIDEGWFGCGEQHPELLDRIGDFTLQMQAQYTIGDRVAGEPATQLRGVHGGTSAAEMFVPLIVAGR